MVAAIYKIIPAFHNIYSENLLEGLILLLCSPLGGWVGKWLRSGWK